MAIDNILAHTIVEIIKDQKGEIIGYKLETGENILKKEAISLARQGAIKAIELSSSTNSEEDMARLLYGDGNNNLRNLPII